MISSETDDSSNLYTAWIVVGLLVPVALLNYLDRQMLAAMKFSVMHDISGIHQEADWGKVLALFKWVYAFLSPIGGYLSDRYSRRHVIVGSLFAWSVITWLTGQVTTYDQLLATRALMGVSEAFYIPAALALIADFHRGSTRSRAVGAHQMGIYTGVIIGGFSGYVADQASLGWRWAFEASGAIGVLYAIPLFFLLKNPIVPAVAALFYSPRISGLGGARLDAIDSERAVWHWPGKSRSLCHIILAACSHRRCDPRRLAGGSLDEKFSTRSNPCQCNRNADDRPGNVRCRVFSSNRSALGCRRLPDPVRIGFGILRLQQYADSLSGGAS